jgi:hypothetical protein
MTIQKVHRMYPPNYTGDSVKKLNDYLLDGWKVVRVDPISHDGKTIYNDYLLEK